MPASPTVTVGRLTAVGRGTVSTYVRHYPDVWLSTGHHPRSPARRGGRRALLLVRDDEFDRMIDEDDLLEWAVGAQPPPALDTAAQGQEALAAGRSVLLDNRPAGSAQHPAGHARGAVRFLAPPSWTSMAHRLVGRAPRRRAAAASAGNG
ncbi:guanylate kinase [Kocuria rhizophila]|nr:guanylate kinase [Kocuria rhizophila]